MKNYTPFRLFRYDGDALSDGGCRNQLKFFLHVLHTKNICIHPTDGIGGVDMKIRKIKVQIKPLNEALDEFVEVGKRIQYSQTTQSRKATYIADAETARAIFTESRLRLIQTLKKKSPGSIYELAKLLERDFKNVYNDVNFLSNLGIIQIKENKVGRKQKKPKLICDHILFELAA